MEPKDFLAPACALTAVSIAILIFLLPKTVDVYKTRRRSTLNIDMPDKVRNNWLFWMEIFLDNFAMLFSAFFVLIIAMYFIYVIANAVYYCYFIPKPFPFLSPLFSISTDQAFWYGLGGFVIVIFLTFLVSLMWLRAGDSISTYLPTIEKAFAEMTFDMYSSKGMRQELLDAARRFIEREAYNEAILHAVTSIEYELRRKLNLGTSKSFGAVMSRIARMSLVGIEGEELNRLVIMRNNIAHNVNCVNYGENEAKEVLERVEGILHQLDILGVSAIYE